MTAVKVKNEIKTFGSKKRAQHSLYFFKTGKGEYGEGDKFLGLTISEQRSIAKKYQDLSLREIQKLLDSSYHEQRMVGLIILTLQFSKAATAQKNDIYSLYIKNTHNINNWDLVDVTAHIIIGQFLLERPRKQLYVFAQSNNLWEKRIAIISTYAFIRQGQFSDTLKIAKILLRDEHDLIHKAVGWMLREVGNRDKKAEKVFLDAYAYVMPRTMLRYAIEKFPEKERQKYLSQRRLHFIQLFGMIKAIVL
ncbi:MAG: DNA alkylation repair protein [Candidatus Kerfeldbacteria bacterium CG08_land_8_20_14_0_20_42_7]|uniref:DNA alkylation repair protein n=1 Tax=Candidatus Kerfeldbacteria bacterium CG08_land_8_20_14_0_20_42_7 TaxID=2014245 RepID=A0A2H0YVQ2_9BACT|nr:MAG: DNA alkylation repair protein [Candidatus Kerfeldbacteria bacterium CG08_land_8_20_14_0_20_42_7]